MTMTFLMLLFCVGFCFMPCAPRSYIFVDQKMNWTEAQQYCREKYTDLATITSLEDINALPRPSSFTGEAWIGLSDDPGSWYQTMTSDPNSWRWSSTGSTSPGAYQNWTIETEPDFLGANHRCICVRDGTWTDYECTDKLPFVCYNGSTEKQFFLIRKTLSWHDALTYCRSRYKDLAMIESEAEQSQVVSLIKPTGYTRVWIGLYREPWRWSDNTVSDFMNWAQGQPDNHLKREHCVDVRPDHTWADVDCALKHPFICHGELKSSINMEMLFSAGIDVSDPEINKQILKLLKEKLGTDGVDLKLKWKKPPTKKKKKKKTEL